jgi:hypothetical protein
MILETPSFKVTNIIFESYEHRSKIILQLLTSFVFLKVGFVPHRRIYSYERKMRVAGEEHLVQRSFPISNNKHVAMRFLYSFVILQRWISDVGGRHPWEVLSTQRSEVKTPYCKVVVYERPF